MGKLNKIGLVVALAAATSAMGAVSAGAQTILRFNLWVPPTHHTHTQMMMPWAEEVAKATAGRVKVEFTPASLGPPPRQYDLAATGQVDLAFGDHAYSPGRFLLTKMVEMPFIGNSAEALSVAYWRIYSALPQAEKEHEGTKLLAVFTHGPAGIMTTKTKVDSDASVQGLKLRVPGEVTSRIATLMGAVPVSVPATQVFELLSQGVVGGSFYNIDAYKNFRLDRFMKFVTTVPDGLYNVSFFLVMNKAKWESLSKQDQDAIMSVSGEAMARRAGRVWDQEDTASLALMKQNNVTVTEMAGPFREAVAAKLKPIRTEWVESVKQQGIDGEALLARLKQEYTALKK